jgi:hypothetical protein
VLDRARSEISRLLVDMSKGGVAGGGSKGKFTV